MVLTRFSYYSIKLNKTLYWQQTGGLVLFLVILQKLETSIASYTIQLNNTINERAPLFTFNKLFIFLSFFRCNNVLQIIMLHNGLLSSYLVIKTMQLYVFLHKSIVKTVSLNTHVRKTVLLEVIISPKFHFQNVNIYISLRCIALRF